MRLLLLPILAFGLATPAQEKPDIPKPKVVLVAHVASIVADGITTRQIVVHGGYEGDPLVRPLIGRRPDYSRMALFGAGEVIVVHLLAKKYHKLLWLEAALAGVHGGCAIHNARLR